MGGPQVSWSHMTIHSNRCFHQRQPLPSSDPKPRGLPALGQQPPNCEQNKSFSLLPQVFHDNNTKLAVHTLILTVALKAVFPPPQWGHLAMSRDILGCHSLGEGRVLLASSRNEAWSFFIPSWKPPQLDHLIFGCHWSCLETGWGRHTPR